MRRFLIMLIVTLVVSEKVFAQTTHVVQDGISIDVSLTPTSFTVGDPITLQIKAKTDGQKQLELNEETSFGSFSIIDQHTLLDIPVVDGRNWIWSLQLDTFDASAVSLSGIVIYWTDVHGKSGSITIEPIPVHIKSVAGPSLQEMSLRDIKGTLPLVTKNWWLYLLYSVLGISLLLLAAKFIREKPTIPPPHEQALSELQALRESNLDVLHFYTELSNIVRRYLEVRFHIAATGQTTREFLVVSKKNQHLEPSDRQSLSTFLVAADLVKFARFEPTDDVCNAAIDQAEQFIASTIPKPDLQQVEIAA